MSKIQQARKNFEAEGRRVVGKAGREVRQAGRHAWLAGLGTVAVTAERGRSFFSRLVEAGERFEGAGRPEMPAALKQVGEHATGLGRKLGERTRGGVASVTRGLGVPSSHEVQELVNRIERLTDKIEGLEA